MEVCASEKVWKLHTDFGHISVILRRLSVYWAYSSQQSKRRGVDYREPKCVLDRLPDPCDIPPWPMRVTQLAATRCTRLSLSSWLVFDILLHCLGSAPKTKQSSCIVAPGCQRQDQCPEMQNCPGVEAADPDRASSIENHRIFGARCFHGLLT